MFASFTSLLANASNAIKSSMDNQQIKMFEIKPTVIYVRASTQEQNTEAQQYSCEQFCAENGLDVVKVVVEKCSAYKFDSQSGLEKILGEFSDINLVVNSIDRLSRNVIKADGLLSVFNEKNITLMSCKERVSTITALGRHEFRSIISASQYESELISERVRNSVKYRKENGIHIGKAKYGYVVFDKKLVKSHEEQKVIRFILSICRQQMQIFKISDFLKRLLTDLGRAYDYAPVSITVEDRHHEYAVLPEDTKVKVTFQTIAEILNDYGVFNRGKKWTSVAVGRVYKSASNIDIGKIKIE